MKPFLFLGTRAEDPAADGEYVSVLRAMGLRERDLRRVRLEREPLGPVNLDRWSGIVLGGGPFNVSDPPEGKSDVQRRVEAELGGLARLVVAEDFPFLGACYGIGTLGVLEGGRVDRTYGEPIGATPISLTEAGLIDPLFSALPARFEAFLGHKEAVARMPDGAVLLATGEACPGQGFRMRSNVYAPQFHPELDAEDLCLRIDIYREYGYFDPDDADVLKAAAREAPVTEPPRLLRRFAELYAR